MNDQSSPPSPPVPKKSNLVARKKPVRFKASGSQEKQSTLVAELLEDYLVIHQQAVSELMADLNLTAMQRADALSRLSQALDRTLRSLAKASPEVSKLTIAMEILEKMSDFIQQRYPQHLEAFLEILEPFGQEVMKTSS